MKYESHNVSLPNGTAFFWTMLTCVLAFTLASFRFMEQVYRNEKDTEGVIASEKAPSNDAPSVFVCFTGS